MIGIYKITNLKNGDCYIGSSKDIGKRWKKHISLYNKNGRCYNYLIYKAFRKYGINNFKFEVLEECEEGFLIKQEQYYYEMLNPKYNLIQPMENPMENPEVRRRQKIRCKEFWDSRSEASKQQCFKNLEKGTKSIEFERNKKKSKPIKAINIKTGEVRAFSSMWEAEKELNINRSSISQIIDENHIRKQSKGYKFELVNSD